MDRLMLQMKLIRYQNSFLKLWLVVGILFSSTFVGGNQRAQSVEYFMGIPCSGYWVAHGAYGGKRCVPGQTYQPPPRYPPGVDICSNGNYCSAGSYCSLRGTGCVSCRIDNHCRRDQKCFKGTCVGRAFVPIEGPCGEDGTKKRYDDSGIPDIEVCDENEMKNFWESKRKIDPLCNKNGFTSSTERGMEYINICDEDKYKGYQRRQKRKAKADAEEQRKAYKRIKDYKEAHRKAKAYAKREAEKEKRRVDAERKAQRAARRQVEAKRQADARRRERLAREAAARRIREEQKRRAEQARLREAERKSKAEVKRQKAVRFEMRQRSTHASRISEELARRQRSANSKRITAEIERRSMTSGRGGPASKPSRLQEWATSKSDGSRFNNFKSNLNKNNDTNTVYPGDDYTRALNNPLPTQTSKPKAPVKLEWKRPNSPVPYPFGTATRPRPKATPRPSTLPTTGPVIKFNQKNPSPKKDGWVMRKVKEALSKSGKKWGKQTEEWATKVGR